MAVPETAEKEDKTTPLTRACLDGDAEMVRFLLECCADPNERDGLDDIPLAAATTVWKPDSIICVELLLKAGADPNASVSSTKKMPILHRAFNNAAFVQMLLDAGADPTVCNEHGYGAKGWAEIQAQWGADPDAVRIVSEAADAIYQENSRRFEEEERARPFTTQERVTLMRPLNLSSKKG